MEQIEILLLNPWSSYTRKYHYVNERPCECITRNTSQMQSIFCFVLSMTCQLYTEETYNVKLNAGRKQPAVSSGIHLRQPIFSLACLIWSEYPGRQETIIFPLGWCHNLTLPSGQWSYKHKITSPRRHKNARVPFLIAMACCRGK